MTLRQLYGFAFGFYGLVWHMQLPFLLKNAVQSPPLSLVFCKPILAFYCGFHQSRQPVGTMKCLERLPARRSHDWWTFLDHLGLGTLGFIITLFQWQKRDLPA
jgi:hypothetical protein